MKKELIKVLNQQAKLTKEQEVFLNDFLVEKEVKKGTLLNTEGQICRELYYIIDGIVRFYAFDKNGTEQTSFFLGDHKFVTDLASFSQKTPAYGFLQAETDCKLVCISHDKFEFFGQKIPSWYPFIIENCGLNFQTLLGLNRRLLHMEAKEGYMTLLEFYPKLDEQVPLQHISSYLGITQQSLSRIRKELLSTKN